MSAATAERNTPERDPRQRNFPVEGTKKLLAGTIAVMNAAGYAEPATAALLKTGLGRVKQTADNTNGADGDVRVEVERGCFRWANAGDVTLAHVGSSAYAVDDQTVSASSDTNARSVIGTIADVDAAGVWVEI